MNTDVLLAPILVADDDPTDVFFLERRLRMAAVPEPVRHLGDGMDAVDWFQRGALSLPDGAHPWIMFLDLKMPRLNGFEVLGWMQERRITDELTVIVLSTSDDPRDMANALELGAERFLVKYPRPEELAEVIGPARHRALERWAAGFGGSDVTR